MIERYFSNRRENHRKENTCLLLRKIAYIYLNLPNDPTTFKDGPCSAVALKGKLDMLSEDDNGFLDLDGNGKKELRIQVLARGDENWIGFGVKEKRVRMVQLEDDVEIHYEEKVEGKWKNLLVQEGDWEKISKSIEFIENEILTA